MALEESATNSQPFGLRGNGNDIGDGVFAATRTSTRNGLFGQNQARTRHTPNAPVGNGVCGLSSVPDASGVFGLNDGGGIGVAGHSNSGDGVVGTTDTSSKKG